MPKLPDRLRHVARRLVRFHFALACALLTFACSPGVFAQQPAWQRIGPPGGNVISLAVTASNTVFLGAADGHVFISRDAGKHWSLRGRVSPRQDAVIQKLLVDRRNENQLLAAVWFQDVREGGGLFRSDDAGATWTAAGLRGELARTVEQSASAPESFFAGTRSGVFHSADSAQTWRRISPADDVELRNVDSLAIDPRDAQIIYAGTYHLPWKTSDGGATWFPVAAGMIDDSDVMSLRIDGANPARIFASACSGIYRSENAAATWTKLQGIPYAARRTQAIVQDPGDPRILYAATTEGLWRTRDAGESWMRATPRDWIVNAVVVLANTGGPGTHNAILLGTEAQGVLVSTDGAATFAPVNDGFSHRVAAALVGDPLQTDHLLAWLPGLPEPLLETRDGGAHWQALPGRAPADIARIFSTSAGWWLASAGDGLLAYDNAAAKWNSLRFVAAHAPVRRAPPSSRQTPPAARQKNAPEIPLASDISEVLTVGARVFVATPKALWAGTLGGKILRPFAISAPATELTAKDFAGEALWMVAAGRAWRSLDAGQTWTPAVLRIESNNSAQPMLVMDDEIRWISAPPAFTGAPEQTLRVLLAGTSQGLYRRTGEHAPWQFVQNGLPAGAPVAYAFHEGLWAVAMRNGGVYASHDASQTWDRLDTAAEASPFTGLAFTADGGLVAASLTEGLLRHAAAEAHSVY